MHKLSQSDAGLAGPVDVRFDIARDIKFIKHAAAKSKKWSY